MKLSKTSWIILIVGVLVVAFGTLGIARAQQVQEQKQLDEELAVAEKRLSNLQLKELRSRKSELEVQIEQTASQLETTKDSLRQSVESIEVTDSVFEIAEACGVEIIDVSSSELGTDDLEGVAYSIIQLNMRVEGDVPNLISFVIKLNDDFTTGAVRSVQMDIQGVAEEVAGEAVEEEEEGEEEEEVEEEVKKPSAGIRLVVYAYRGE